MEYGYLILDAKGSNPMIRTQLEESMLQSLTNVHGVTKVGYVKKSIYPVIVRVEGEDIAALNLAVENVGQLKEVGRKLMLTRWIGQ